MKPPSKGEIIRVAAVAAELLGPDDEENLVVRQDLREQHTRQQLGAHREPDLLLDQPRGEDAAPHKLVGKVHLQHAGSLRLNEAGGGQLHSGQPLLAGAPVWQAVGSQTLPGEGEQPCGGGGHHSTEVAQQTLQLLQVSLVPPVVQPEQRVEVDEGEVAELSVVAPGVPARKGAEEGVDQEDRDLLLRQRDAVSPPCGEEGQGAGQEVGGRHEQVDHPRQDCLEETLRLLGGEFLREKFVKSSEGPV